MICPVYSTQAVRWQPLSSIRADKTHAAKFDKLFFARENLRQALQEKRWLLEENQHLVVPPTHLDDYQGRIFSMGDFVQRADEARDLDVLETSMDEHGQRRLLSPEQFQQLKQTGELDVPSKLFENQHHTWKVAGGFYSGTDNVRRSFGRGFGKALDHYVVYTSDAVMKEEDNKRLRPTLRKALQNGFGRAVRLLRGAAGQLFAGRLRHRTHSEDHIDFLMEEAELSYVLYHLRGHDTRCLFDRDAYRTMHSEADLEIDERWNTLVDDGEFDRKYFQPSEQRKAAQKAQKELDLMRDTFYEKVASRRNLQLNIDRAKALESPLGAIAEAERAENEWLEARDQSWIDHLKSQAREDLKALGLLEVDRLLAQQIENELRRKDDEMVVDALKSYKDSLNRKRPVLSLSSAWTNRKLDMKRLEIRASLESTRLERITQRLEDQGLEVQCTARKLVTEFRRDHRKVLATCLRSKLSSFPPATFEVLQLNPKHWTFDRENGVKRHKTVKVDLGKPFWRMRYSWMMAITLTKSMIGGAFHFLTSGPFSLRAFFSPRPYYAVERPVRDERSLTQTLNSRLRSFHATLKAVRERFDSEPDTGLIGKSIQSSFLQIYLALKGAVGSLGIVTFMTVGTIFSSLLSLVVLTVAPVTASILTIINALFNLTVYDTAIAAARNRGTGSDSEMPSCASPLLKIGLGVPYFLVVPGALQAVFATIRLVVVHPASGTVCLAWASLRFALRSLRDSLTWFFIRKYSRIPASNTFLAWRIHGPGLALTEYYRLPVEAAKASVLLSLDSYRLRAHAQVRRRELDAPYHCYLDVFNGLVHPFGVEIFTKVSRPTALESRMTSEFRSRRLCMHDGYRENTAFTPAWHDDEAEDGLIENLPEAESFNCHQQSQSKAIVPVTAEHPLDIWAAVAQGLRSTHPDFGSAQDAAIMQSWDNILSPTASLAELDQNILVNLEAAYNKHKSSGTTELDEMVNRASRMLAEWNLKMDLREKRLMQAVAIPPRAVERFRMKEVEQQDLWKFTLAAVEIYGQQIKEELEEVLETSEFSTELRKTVSSIADSFYTDCGARPGQDFPVVASFLLRQLLGGDKMLETLEQTDERLVLSPKMSEEDEHLVFWKSFETM